MKTSVGVCAYNEQDNIGNLLECLLVCPEISEVIVVASGCTDDTVKIASSYPVRLIVDIKRRGKAVAINQFIGAASGDILIIESADTIPKDDAFYHLLKNFYDDTVGMVGAHPVPVNSGKSMMDKVGRLMWKAHHEMALRNPKAGEVCAFRNIIDGIDPRTAVDEASIESQITSKGYKLVYEPEAIIYNKSPETISDFIKQRKRIYHGHLQLKKSGYQVPSLSMFNIVMATIKAAGYRHYMTMGVASILEMYSRMLARKEFMDDSNNEPSIWEISESTKRLK